MRTWIALLRGINVGGRHRLPMKELVEDLQALGLEQVTTYIQSGNVVFQAPDDVAEGLDTRISERIEARHGFKPHVFLLSADQLEQAIAANPYPEADDAPKSVHLFFLDAPPPAPDFDVLTAVQQPSERFHLTDHVFYLHTPDGFGRSKLVEKIGKALRVNMTARNWRTVRKLQDMVNDL